MRWARTARCTGGSLSVNLSISLFLAAAPESAAVCRVGTRGQRVGEGAGGGGQIGIGHGVME